MTVAPCTPCSEQGGHELVALRCAADDALREAVRSPVLSSTGCSLWAAPCDVNRPETGRHPPSSAARNGNFGRAGSPAVQRLRRLKGGRLTIGSMW